MSDPNPKDQIKKVRNAEKAFRKRPDYDTAVALQRAKRNHKIATQEAVKLAVSNEGDHRVAV